MEAPVQAEVFGLVEMGSNSLKLYVVPRGAKADTPIETIKLPWRVAHDLFARGSLAAETAEEVVERVREATRLLDDRRVVGMLAIATGVFRELPETDALALRVREATGVVPRVIGGEDEASLMARGFRELSIAPPAVMCDLGGASLEWAWMPERGAGRSGSLSLGAIRNEYLFAHLRSSPERYLAESTAHCDAALSALPVVGPARVVATGGTAEALAAVVGRTSVSSVELAEVIARVLGEGPPGTLKPGRQAVFLPGLVILSRVVARAAAAGLEYGTSAVRLGMVRRLIQLLERFPPDELHATQLLRMTQAKR
ncbi:MAG: hypothetical protein HYY06_32465 [Deltaproteobacteria bacterium]|nr:hypothetical protein [Deltaproteobacteria bacterium]